MPHAAFDPNGIRVGRLLVLSRHESGAWYCVCDCGRTILLNRTEGSIPSNCGCRRRAAAVRHGGHGTPHYTRWRSIIARCENTRSPFFKNYGARGIKICDSWRNSFDAFKSDVGPQPGPEYSLDRIDNNGDYCPGNVRWGTRHQQQNNKRGNRRLEFGGQSRTIAEWAAHLGLNYNSLRTRLRKGWSVERALMPGRVERTHATLTCFGRTQSVQAWCREMGLSSGTVCHRLDRGWPVERALTQPAEKKTAHAVKVTIAGRTMTVSQWCAHLNMPYERVRVRIYKGWAPEAALQTPIGACR